MNKIDQFLFKCQKIPATSKIFFLQNLSIMVKAGVSLANGLKTLGAQTKDKKLKYIINDIGEQINRGKNFGESIEPYQKDFGEMFVNMVKAGEISGRLEEVLRDLSIQTKKEHEIKAKIKHALIYPIVILTAIIAIGTFMIFFVLPNITGMFEDLEVELPLATRILIKISDYGQANGLITGIIGLVVLGSLIKIARTKRGKYYLDIVLLKTPIISPIIQKINLAKMARNLSALIKTDIDIVNTIEITARIIGNSLYQEALHQSAEQVKKGEKIANILQQHPKLFPPIITQMIAVGEETGALDEVLEKMADFYEEEVTQTMENLPTIIEPILMVLMGLAVAGIALAVLMPMFTLTQSF
jgi:type IV pilus assembly protein PilC